MEDNKDLIPEAETESIQSQEVVAESATTDEGDKEVDATEVKESEAKDKTVKKDKKPMSKKKKITIITACSVLGAIVLGLIIWVLVLFFGPSPTQDVSTAPLKVDMGDKYYVGTIGEIDYTKMFPEGKEFNLNGDTLTYKLGEDTITKKVIKIEGGVNVDTYEELADNIKAGNKIVIQNAKLSAPDITGKKENEVNLTLEVKNDVYGNGAIVNVHELVVTRTKGVANGVIGPKSNGAKYLDKYSSGYVAFSILPTEKQIVFQDVHITGNDMSKEEGGNLYGLTDDVIKERGVKLFSAYGDLLHIFGNADGRANVKVYHCVVENGHKVVHVEKADLDLEGTIIRNASDTTLSIATHEGTRSVVNSKNNVIANSLTGAILFYSDGAIAKDKEQESWNELNVEGFLDIYNWKLQDSLAFLPETEGAYESLANSLVGSTIQSEEYDKLKAIVDGSKYIHFAIIKIRTSNNAVAYNGSTVNFKNDIGYTTSREQGYPKGFPIPGIAAKIMYDMDVWGYYSNKKGDVTPTSGISDKIYKELVEGRK